MEPYTRNGGIIGKTMDFGATDSYVIGETTESSTITHTGSYRTSGLGSTSTRTITLGSLTGGSDSAPQEGDVVFVYFTTNPDDTAQISYRISGYTQLENIYVSDSERVQLQIGYKVMGASPDTSVTITNGTADVDQAYVIGITVWRGIDPTSITSTNSSAINTARPNPPAVTPTVSGSYILAVGASGHFRSTAIFTSSDLTDFRTLGANDTHDTSLGFGFNQWSSGTFDPALFGFTGTDSTSFASAAASIIIEPITTTVQLLGNKKNSGIWDLQAVYENAR